MIWATWRLGRPLYASIVLLAAAAAVLLAVTGARQESAWQAFSALHCNQPGASASCMQAAGRYYAASDFSSAGVAIGMLLPGFLGLVLGTPLVATEYSLRTNRLGWTQSITRTRWLLDKALVGCLVTVAVAGVLVPVLQWWTGAVQRPRMVSFDFDVSGIVPVAYALFAFALGALVGAVVKRTGWAFAAGVALFAATRYLERSFLRVHLAATTFTAKLLLAPADVWLVQQGYVPLGRVTPAPGESWQSGAEAIGRCATNGQGLTVKPACAGTLRLHFVSEIQPASHYWPLQLAEAGVFLAAAAALLALTVLSVRRWRT
ncbi:MAG TPA: ABC transporter permease subunit [Acidimicrobiales bacterium]|nr:ABC transporter permease subunit [Acidimicrobiales bacterium]